MPNVNYAATPEEIQQAATICGIVASAVDETHTPTFEDTGETETSTLFLIKELGRAAFEPGGDSFAAFVSNNRQRIVQAAALDDGVSRVLFIGYRMGISADSGPCMNDLGALYYMGDFVEQDYQKAADLYEMAMDHGYFQSIINLGYIWEYGRTDRRDYQKAHQCYALAAALTDASEAVYKLGDMYSRGQAVKQDIAKAYQLWKRSLELAQTTVEIAQPAIRISQVLISPDRAEATGIEPDPFQALQLFQQAEIGLRIDIENGMSYYRKQLQEAISGQQIAREMLDNPVPC